MYCSTVIIWHDSNPGFSSDSYNPLSIIVKKATLKINGLSKTLFKRVSSSSLGKTGTTNCVTPLLEKWGYCNCQRRPTADPEQCIIP